MKYFAAFLTMKDEEKSEKYRQAHIDYLEELRKEKKVFMYGRLADGAGGLIIYQGDHIEEVTEWVKGDPYIEKGARGFKVHEWDMKTDYTISE